MVEAADARLTRRLAPPRTDAGRGSLHAWVCACSRIGSYGRPSTAAPQPPIRLRAAQLFLLPSAQRSQEPGETAPGSQGSGLWRHQDGASSLALCNMPRHVSIFCRRPSSVISRDAERDDDDEGADAGRCCCGGSFFFCCCGGAVVGAVADAGRGRCCCGGSFFFAAALPADRAATPLAAAPLAATAGTAAPLTAALLAATAGASKLRYTAAGGAGDGAAAAGGVDGCFCLCRSSPPSSWSKSHCTDASNAPPVASKAAFTRASSKPILRSSAA